jgi:hypothetical protein
MSILSQANELVRQGKYSEALILYYKIADTNNDMKEVVNFNIKILERKNLKKPEKVFKEIAESDFFDHKFYYQEYFYNFNSSTDLVSHYIEIGAELDFNPSNKFNTKFYKEYYRDVASSKINPLYHFIKHGIAEGRLPKDNGVKDGIVVEISDLDLIKQSKYFDASWYKSQFFDVNPEEIVNPELHYLNEGHAKGYDPSTDFSTLGYLGYYRDVLTAGVNPLVHFLRSGQKEGRKPKPDMRAAQLGLARLTPAESGQPESILNFDSHDSQKDKYKNKKLFVHVHLYHEEMLDQILNYLGNIEIAYELGVSVKSQKYIIPVKEKIQKHLKNALNVVVKNVPNKGRDVAPWIVYFHEEIKRSDLFIHLHTKKSLHNPNHADWFRFAMHNIMGSKGIVSQIFDILENDSVGVVAPCYFWSLSEQPNYGKNRNVVEGLYKKITKNELPDECPDYPAGSFFWIKSEVVKPLLDLNLKLDDFDEEAGQIDETLAHGVERLIGLLPLLIRKKVHKVAVDIAFDMVNYVYPGRKVNLKNISDRIRYKAPILKRKKNTKIAIFSCVSGGYEEITPLVKNSNGVDIFLYTDNNNTVAPDGVILRQSPYVSHIPVMTARYVKTHPHIWFENYDYIFWIDSNIYFMGEINKYLDMLEATNGDIGVIYHPARYSFIEEGIELAQTSKVNIDTLNSQISKYKKNKNIMKSRLIETNFWVCKPSNPLIIDMMKIWWREINNFTHRDQISVNYAVEMAGVKVINLMPNGESARSHPDFLIFEHAFNEREKLISNLQVELDK